MRRKSSIRGRAGTCYLEALEQRALFSTTTGLAVALQAINAKLPHNLSPAQLTGITTLQNQIANGTNGVTSDTTTADPTHKITSVIDSALFGLTIFNGQPVDTSSVLIESTYYGDSNLDRKVDVTDLGTLATNYGSNIPNGILQGDFNGDGKVDVTDLMLLATDYGPGNSGEPFSNPPANPPITIPPSGPTTTPSTPVDSPVNNSPPTPVRYIIPVYAPSDLLAMSFLSSIAKKHPNPTMQLTPQQIGLPPADPPRPMYYKWSDGSGTSPSNQVEVTDTDFGPLATDFDFSPGNTPQDSTPASPTDLGLLAVDYGMGTSGNPFTV